MFQIRVFIVLSYSPNRFLFFVPSPGDIDLRRPVETRVGGYDHEETLTYVQAHSHLNSV